MVESIPKERWGELRESFAEFGETELPDGEIFGILKDGEIIGYYLVEIVKHVGPFWVARKYRGNGVGGKLATHAAQTIEGRYYTAALSSETESMCRKLGMEEIAGKLFTK